MAGGPGAAGVPASAARSLPRPRACRVPGWARRGMAPGGGGRRRAARSLPRLPGLSGSRQRPRSSLFSSSRARQLSLAPPARRPCLSGPVQSQKRAGWRAPGVGRRPPSLRGLSEAASGGRGSQPPACSLLPRRASHFRPQDPCRPPDLRTDPAYGKGGKAAGLRAPAGPRGRREDAAPQPPPHAGRSASAACRGLQRRSRGTGDEMKPVCFFFRAALQERKKKAKGTRVGGKG